MTKAIPEGLRTVTPALAIDGCAEAIEFYEKALGAVEEIRVPDPSGKKIWHAQVRIGDSASFLNDTFPEMGPVPGPASLWVYAGDVDRAFKRAVDAGAVVVMPLADMFWGDRLCSVADRWGNLWNLAQRTKDLSPEEMQRGGEAMAEEWSKNKE
jgi:uncharacterized glyoxalase superfamily protein PhnB